MSTQTQVSIAPESRSERAPVAGLPPEILSLIFQVSHPDDDKFHNGTVIRISHVCRFWRAVALACPSLWKDIKLGQEGSNEFAERSQTFPIRLFVLVPLSRLQRTRSAVYASLWFLPNCDRVQTLVVDMPPEAFRSFSNICSRLRCVTSLVASCFTGEDDIIPALKLHGSLSQRLQLDSVAIDLQHCSDLVHLSLTNITTADPFHPTISHLLKLIRRCPRLRVLELRDLDMEIQESDWDGEKVVLSDLEKLCIERVDDEFAKCLLDQLCIPSSAPLVACRRGKRLVETESIDGQGSDLHGLSPHTILIDPNNCRVSFGGNGCSDAVTLWKDMAGDVSHFMLACASTVDLSSVHALKITAFPLLLSQSIAPITDIWVKFLSKFAALTTLELCTGFEFTSGFLRAFGFEDELSSSYDLCPKLKRVYLETDAPNYEVFDGLGKLIVRALGLRATIGKPPLERLELNFGDDELKGKLNGLATDVTFVPSKWFPPGTGS